MPFGKHTLGDVRHVDTVGGDQGNSEFGFDAPCHFSKYRPWHAGHDRRYPRFVPADTGVDQAGASGLDGTPQLHHLLPGTPLFDQIDHRQAEDDQEILAYRLTNPRDNLDSETHAVLERASPVVVA